jgi:hypothetical protein
MLQQQRHAIAFKMFTSSKRVLVGAICCAPENPVALYLVVSIEQYHNKTTVSFALSLPMLEQPSSSLT